LYISIPVIAKFDCIVKLILAGLGYKLSSNALNSSKPNEQFSINVAVVGTSLKLAIANAISSTQTNSNKGQSINSRDKIISKLNKEGINARPIWQLNHKINIYRKCPKMNLSNAEKLEKKIINLPSSAHLLFNEKK